MRTKQATHATQTELRKDVIIAANITYLGTTFNTKLKVEYRHTGERYSMNAHEYTVEEGRRRVEAGEKIKHTSGYWYIDRLAIYYGPDQYWYINNDGDKYEVNKISKYGRKIHAELSKETIIFERKRYKP